jgi:transcriptional regulator with XRE-family HTH domain
MRIKLKAGKQKELILKAKENKSWKELANRLGFNEHYLSNELRREMRTLTEKTYARLCNIANVNFDENIAEKLNETWGQSLGGQNSIGSTKPLPKIKFNEKLAEFIGATLGDGHIEYNNML